MSSIWRGLKKGASGGLAVARSGAEVDSDATTKGDAYLRGLPRDEDGALVLEVDGAAPAPPETGTFVLTSTDGVLSWEDAS